MSDQLTSASASRVDVEFSFRPAALIAGAISVTLLTMVVRALNSCGVTTRPPLEVLRNEVG